MMRQQGIASRVRMMNQFFNPRNGRQSIQPILRQTLIYQYRNQRSEFNHRCMTHLLQKIRQRTIGRLTYLPIRIAQHIKQPVQKIGQIIDHANVRNGIQHGDPSHEQLSNVRIGPSYIRRQQRQKMLHVKRFALCHNILHEPIQQIGTVLDIHIHIGKQFRQPIKYLVKIPQYRSPRHLGNIVQTLARIIPHPTLRVIKAMQHGKEQSLQMTPRVPHETDGRGGNPDQPPLAIIGVHAGAKILG
mmetsp:Transcript_28101/g.59333  ORF Transcript_28101/g.59333 Transcript_28101/m.59333 type:complete len:244 (+) Transcript_28101:1807-2538(+)